MAKLQAGSGGVEWSALTFVLKYPMLCKIILDV
jgi:hypothetical protein